ncbi:MAG: hypothetical protein IAC58_01865 [Firmicutes bacterium]|uniref:Uncharacterized protein n=1 Tax=Candidatus Onthovivens merdipullorum TaxID=2840889 RepID=A0A9D9DIT6_9BACL|nr:hypothetical protein [Candidatus Onthovivens merdipullorum]
MSEKRIFNSWFKFSNEYCDYLKYLINIRSSDEYYGYYLAFIFSKLACDCEVVRTKGMLPTNDKGEIDSYKISCILGVDPSKVPSILITYKDLGFISDNRLVNIDLFYGANLGKVKSNNKRYYDDIRGLIHQNGYIVYYDLDQKKFIYKKYSKMDESELSKARDYCIDQINSKKGGNYEVKKYSE